MCGLGVHLTKSAAGSSGSSGGSVTISSGSVAVRSASERMELEREGLDGAGIPGSSGLSLVDSKLACCKQ